MGYKCTLALAAVVIAAPANAWVASTRPNYTFAELAMFHHEALKQLRQEVLLQQQADGGKLSRASLTRFQARLDELNRQYMITLRRNDPFSVDGMGAPVARAYDM